LKTYRNLYPQVYAWENLELAYRKARKAAIPAQGLDDIQALELLDDPPGCHLQSIPAHLAFQQAVGEQGSQPGCSSFA